MTPDLKTDSSLGLTPLIAGIIEDAQALITQQLSLFQSELKEDLGRTKAAAIPLFTGVAVCLLAGFFLFTMVVRFLTYQWPDLPEFAAYGLVGAVLGIAGAALVLLGKTQLDSINTLPEKSVKALKENIQWKTKT
jgi:Putative Actinobacterial Holin-X, holin superfamily III